MHAPLKTNSPASLSQAPNHFIKDNNKNPNSKPRTIAICIKNYIGIATQSVSQTQKKS